MKQIFRHSLCIAALCATGVVSATTIPYLAPRSQGINGARELVGWQSQINRWDMCCNYGSFSITPEYGQTFRPHRITEALFSDALIGNDSCNNDCGSTCHNDCSDDCSNDNCNSCDKILIQGSQVAGRDAKALMAENFYLPTDYSSEITFKPKVQNFIVDFNYYQGLDGWAEGLYFRIHTPLAYTRWNLHYCENILDAGVNPMNPGYFNNTYITTIDGDEVGLTRNALLANFEEYVSDCKALENTDTTYNALNSARWSKCSRTKTGLAEITAAFGWNFIRRENFLFGLNIRAAAPTGTRPHGDYLFEPIVGNGKHWELGGGLNMWWTWWRSCDEDRNLTMYLDAYVTHMFKTRQCRTFDLKDKPLSRYMLAMNFTSSASNLVAGPEFRAPTAQFDNVFTPLANLTTIPVDVSYAAQGEVILKFAYTHCNFQFDLGYDFWGRTCEKICKRCDCCNNGFVDNAWGLKGDAFVYGFDARTLLTAVPLSATESLATIFAGTNNPIANEATWNTNPNIDNPQLASSAQLPLQTYNNGWADVNTSLNPVLLTEDDLDISSAKTKACSNKIFTHLGYTWKEHECWTPYLGVGGEVEFGCRDKNCNDNCHSACQTNCNTSCHTSNNCNTDCNGNNANCNKFAFTQWGIWLKGGLSFN